MAELLVPGVFERSFDASVKSKGIGSVLTSVDSDDLRSELAVRLRLLVSWLSA